eukprot:11394700-Alexandrium_andersonii.AAC.1
MKATPIAYPPQNCAELHYSIMPWTQRVPPHIQAQPYITTPHEHITTLPININIVTCNVRSLKPPKAKPKAPQDIGLDATGITASFQQQQHD